MNENLRKMRAALSNYHRMAIEAEQQIKTISEELKPDLAQQRIKEIRQNLKSAKTTAYDQILSAAKSGKSEAESWGTLNTSDLTDDIKILQSGIRLNQKDFDTLCQKYQNNGSMSRVLGEFADKQNRQNHDPDHHLYKVNLATVESKAERWDKLQRTAEHILSNIDGDGFGCGASNNIVKMSVEGFGSTMKDLYD